MTVRGAEPRSRNTPAQALESRPVDMAGNSTLSSSPSKKHEASSPREPRASTVSESESPSCAYVSILCSILLLALVSGCTDEPPQSDALSERFVTAPQELTASFAAGSLVIPMDTHLPGRRHDQGLRPGLRPAQEWHHGALGDRAWQGSQRHRLYGVGRRLRESCGRHEPRLPGRALHHRRGGSCRGHRAHHHLARRQHHDRARHAGASPPRSTV